MRVRDVIGIFDVDAVTCSEATKKCLKNAQDALRIVNAANDLPKSVIIKQEAYGDRIYFSGLSSESIIKRINGHD